MAEVKSALEIAMERAAALGAGDDDSKRQAQEKGQALARQCLEGDLVPADMAAKLAGMASDSAVSAAQALLEALGEERQGALPALEAMCFQGAAKDAYQVLAQAKAKLDEARQVVENELAGEMVQGLAAKGITGSAVRPNPVAHPQYEARCDAALADAEAELKAAGEKLLEALT